MTASVTNLPQEYAARAARELNENPAQVHAHILSLQRWLNSMPHLTCPQTENFLIPFLRHAKYEHSKAQVRLDNFITLRSSDRSSVRDWFYRPPMSDPLVDRYLEMGIHLPLGFTKDGAFLLLVRIGKWNIDALPTNNLLMFITMQIDRLLEDPKVQISGIRLIMDLEGAQQAHIYAMNPSKNAKELLRLLQEAYPIRMRGLIYYHEPPVVDLILKMMMFWMKPKLKERVSRVKNDIRKAMDSTPGLKEVLPAEYGGLNGNIQSLIEKTKFEFKEHYSREPLWSGLKVCEAKRPDSARRFMKEYKEFEGDMLGVAGTYVKLNQDD